MLIPTDEEITAAWNRYQETMNEKMRHALETPLFADHEPQPPFPPPVSKLSDNDVDAQFFRAHPDRQARIRWPIGQEFRRVWLEMGPHDWTRRRVLMWRTPKGHPLAPEAIFRIPMLVRGDETIEDDDATLLPLLAQLMKDARNIRDDDSAMRNWR